MASVPLLNVDDPAAAIAPLKPQSTMRYNDKYVIVYDFSDIGTRYWPPISQSCDVYAKEACQLIRS